MSYVIDPEALQEQVSDIEDTILMVGRILSEAGALTRGFTATKIFDSLEQDFNSLSEKISELNNLTEDTSFFEFKDEKGDNHTIKDNNWDDALIGGADTRVFTREEHTLYVTLMQYLPFVKLGEYRKNTATILKGKEHYYLLWKDCIFTLTRVASL